MFNVLGASYTEVATPFLVDVSQGLAALCAGTAVVLPPATWLQSSTYARARQNGTLVKVDEGSSPFRDIRCSWLACRFHAADWDADGDIDLVVPQGLGGSASSHVPACRLIVFRECGGRSLAQETRCFRMREKKSCRTGSRNPFQYVVTKFVPNHRGWDGMYSSPLGSSSP